MQNFKVASMKGFHKTLRLRHFQVGQSMYSRFRVLNHSCRRISSVCISSIIASKEVCRHYSWDKLVNSHRGADVKLSTGLHPKQKKTNGFIALLRLHSLVLGETGWMCSQKQECINDLVESIYWIYFWVIINNNYRIKTVRCSNCFSFLFQLFQVLTNFSGSNLLFFFFGGGGGWGVGGVKEK